MPDARLDPPAGRTFRRLRTAALWLVSVTLAFLASLPMLVVLANEGANLVAGDEARPLLQFIDPALRGDFDWRELYNASYQNSSSHVLTYLLYYAVAVTLDLDYRAFLVIGVAFAWIRIALLMLLARELVGGKSPVLYVLLPVFAAISFSAPQISNLEFGFISFSFGLVTSAFILGLWSIARDGRNLSSVALVAATGVLISLASGLGPIAWATYALALFARGGIRLASTPLLVPAVLISTTPYLRSIFGTGSYKNELAAEGFSVDLFLRLLGLPVAHAWEVQAAAGILVASSCVLILAPLVIGFRHWRGSDFIAPAGLIFAGLLMTLLLTVLRGFVVWYYVFTGTLVLFGIVLIAAKYLQAYFVDRDRSNAAYLSLACVAITAVALGASLAESSKDHLAKTIFLRWRSPVSESCVRNWEIAPTTCETHLAPWAPGSIPTFANITQQLGQSLQRHALHPFSEEETWRLQGDYYLDTVRVEEGRQDIAWVTPEDAFTAPVEDARHLDLQLPAPSVVTWVVKLPDEAHANLRSAVRMHPGVVGNLDGDGGSIRIALSVDGGPFITRVNERVSPSQVEWSPIELELSQHAGKTVAIRISSLSGANEAFDTFLLRHPTIEVDVEQGARFEPASVTPLGTSGPRLELGVSEQGWALDNLSATGRRFGNASELEIVDIDQPASISHRFVDPPCLDPYTHLEIDMRLEDPWGTGARDMYAIPRSATITFDLGDGPDVELALPYLLQEDYVPRVETYLVPLKHVAIPRGAQLRRLSIAPISTPVPTSTNRASVGSLRLIGDRSGSEANCMANTDLDNTKERP